MRWTHDELVIAMNVYARLPFGQLHSRQPFIIEVASKLNRTPGSLAMKLCNFASFDPQLRARGISGLKGASQLDRQVWEEFEADWETMGLKSEEMLEDLGLDHSIRDETPVGLRNRPEGPTETISKRNQRLGQAFFRRAVLVSYGNRCCITGNPIPQLLNASHIVSWASNPKDRLNPRNGLCLARTQDAAFDRHLITLDADLRLVVSKTIRDHFSNATVRENFGRYEGKKILLPERFLPDPAFLEIHRSQFAS